MNNKFNKLSIILLLILVGCWDERILRDHSLILSIGYDYNSEGFIQKTVTFPKEDSSGRLEKGESQRSQLVTTIGNTVKDAENQIDEIIPKTFDRSKAKVILLGETLAKKGIFSSLDSLYRDLRGPLNAALAVVAGDPEEVLAIQEKYSSLASEYFSDLLESANKRGIIKRENVQSACPIILSEGEDLYLPLIAIKENDRVELEGMALFSGDVMTGKLNSKESKLLLLLDKEASRKLTMNIQVDHDEKIIDKNFVDFVIRNNRRKLVIEVQEDQIMVKVNLYLNIEVNEFSQAHLKSKNRGELLQAKIEHELEMLAQNTIQLIQEANNDALGIGKRISAYHNSLWRRINWKEVYPNITIDPEIKVKIIQHGIIN